MTDQGFFYDQLARRLRGQARAHLEQAREARNAEAACSERALAGRKDEEASYWERRAEAAREGFDGSP